MCRLLQENLIVSENFGHIRGLEFDDGLRVANQRAEHDKQKQENGSKCSKLEDGVRGYELTKQLMMMSRSHDRVFKMTQKQTTAQDTINCKTNIRDASI